MLAEQDVAYTHQHAKHLTPPNRMAETIKSYWAAAALAAAAARTAAATRAARSSMSTSSSSSVHALRGGVNRKRAAPPPDPTDPTTSVHAHAASGTDAAAAATAAMAGISPEDTEEVDADNAYFGAGSGAAGAAAEQEQYVSPLLQFRAYRLNPFFRTKAQRPLDSLTNSNKIDPNRLVCKYALHGKCNDKACYGQHPTKFKMTDHELLQDIVAYDASLKNDSDTRNARISSFATAKQQNVTPVANLAAMVLAVIKPRQPNLQRRQLIWLHLL